MKILKKLSKPILMLLLIFTCVFTNMTYAIPRECADVFIHGRKQYTLVVDHDEEGKFVEMLDNFGRALLRITLQYNYTKTMIGRWRCIEYGTRKEPVVIRHVKSANDSRQKYIARGELSGNPIFKFMFNLTFDETGGLFIENKEGKFKVGDGPIYAVGSDMISHGDTRIVATSDDFGDGYIPTIVYCMLHQ